MPGTESVRVVVRMRPLNSLEISKSCQSIVTMDKESKNCTIMNLKSAIPKSFTYDSVFDTSVTQQEIYDETAFPLVESVLEGYNGTIFAYGQTGCGKTFTMSGNNSVPELRGIIPNSFSHVFGAISVAESSKFFLVRCSYLEIYNEELRDLLDYDPNTKLELKEGKDKGIFVKNLSVKTVKSFDDIDNAMSYGNSHRITKETNMNEKSSRSHAIFTIYIETSDNINTGEHIKAGKLNLVDLAGSERQKKTGATGERMKEAIEINLSLSALGNVISALVDGNQSHIPYRDSKLTRLLQDSLGGNTKTVMVAVVSPADYNYDESLSTLRYASRAKFIQNKPKVNEDPKDTLLREYYEEIQRLKLLLEQRSSGEPIVIEKIVEREKIVEKEKIVEREKIVEVPKKSVKKKKRKRSVVEYSDDFEEERVVKKLESDSEEDKPRPPVQAVKSGKEKNRALKKQDLLPVQNIKSEMTVATRKVELLQSVTQKFDLPAQTPRIEPGASYRTDSVYYSQDLNTRELQVKDKPTQLLRSELVVSVQKPERQVISEPKERPTKDPVYPKVEIIQSVPQAISEPKERPQKDPVYPKAEILQSAPQVISEPKERPIKDQVYQKVEILQPVLQGISELKEKPQKDPVYQKAEILQPVTRKAEAIHNLYNQELELKEKQLKEERIQRQQLEAALAQLQHKLITGGDVSSKIDSEKIKAKRQQLKTKSQKDNPNEPLKDDDEVNEKFTSLQDEVESLRKQLKRSRVKVKSSQAEIDDINKEHEMEKEELLDTIRAKERENDFLHKVFEYMLPSKELFRVKKMSKYDENNHEWHIRPFILQNRQTIFPKLPKVQIYETIQSDLKNRTLVFTKGSQNVPILEEEEEVNDVRNEWREHEAKDSEDKDEMRPITSGHTNRDFNSRRLQTKNLETRELDKRILQPLRK